MLSGSHSPSIDNYEADLAALVSDIHGLTRKPPLGPAPAVDGCEDRFQSVHEVPTDGLCGCVFHGLLFCAEERVRLLFRSL